MNQMISTQVHMDETGKLGLVTITPIEITLEWDHEDHGRQCVVLSIIELIDITAKTIYLGEL